MNISDCLDEIKHENLKVLSAYTLEEIELIQSISNLLYKAKSIRKSIDMIESLTNASYCIRHEVNPELDSIVWNNSGLKDIEILNKKISEPYTGC